MFPCVRCALPCAAFWAWALVGSAWAQEPASDDGAASLAPVVVTGSALGTSSFMAPAQQVGGDELLQRSQSTLGETLNGLPGVSSTYYGPNASRPSIRGLDGERVSVQSNGGASVDLSSLSPDHAVTIDPLLIERVEVLRGPAALAYGGSAAGGVVNVIDGRIQREVLFDERGGITGKLDAGYATGNQERGGAVVLDGGTSRYNLHVDAMSRRAEDTSVPKDLSCTRGGVTTSSRTICNSASETQSGAVGGSLFFDHGYLGAAVSTYDSQYGTAAADEVTIRMRSNKLALEGELRDLSGFLKSAKFQYGQTDYQHTEYQTGVAGTLFKTQGQNLRLQGQQARWGDLEGVLGLQVDDTDFSAVGTASFAPYTHTRQRVAYALEDLATGWGKVSGGVRVESVQVDSDGAPGVTRFVSGSRSFTPVSVSVGSTWDAAAEWQLNANLSSNERAPRAHELYADGEDLAANTRQSGDANLDKERSVNVELGGVWKRGAHQARLQLFQYQFSNYISLEETDATASPVQYTYTQVQARFTGMEAQGNVRLSNASEADPRGQWDWGWRADMVRADNTGTGQPLPRIAPFRIGNTLQWSRAAWSGRLGVDRYGAQDRVPDGQLATEGYTLWSAGLSLRSKLSGTPALWYARLENATDTLAYSASSILTQTVPGKVPLPGRSLKVGLQLTF